MKHNRYIVLIFLLFLGSCGQTGPLYLPGDKPPIYVPDEEQEK